MLVRKDRSRTGGGVALYVNEKLAFNRREDLESNDNDDEFLAIDILLPKTKPILFGVGYRPQTNTDFYTKLMSIFESSPKFLQQEIYILGDFNTDISSKNDSSLKKSLNCFLRFLSLSQIIEKPTRVTDTSSTTIDLIFTTDKEKNIQHGVIPCGISDHDLIYCTRRASRGSFNKHNVQKIRSLKDYSVESLNDLLRKENWFNVINNENVNDAWYSFSSIFKSVIDKIAPIKEIVSGRYWKISTGSWAVLYERFPYRSRFPDVPLTLFHAM